jgi:REP element-mobilizing transposase RayT
MYNVTPASPAYFLTSVAKDRLPIFRTETMKDLACKALDEARTSGSFLVFAYVFMPDHLHVVTDGKKKGSTILRFINGLIARRCINYLKEKRYLKSLKKLRHAKYRDGHQYSLWDHHPNIRTLTNEEMLMQRIKYTHENPVRAGLVDRAEDYRFSSARQWSGEQSETEPFTVDIDELPTHLVKPGRASK